MPVSGALEKYLVKPGSKVDLRKIDADDRHLFDDGGKEESLKAFGAWEWYSAKFGMNVPSRLHGKGQ